jgi:hypothetical protein
VSDQNTDLLHERSHLTTLEVREKLRSILHTKSTPTVTRKPKKDYTYFFFSSKRLNEAVEEIIQYLVDGER